MAAGTVLEHRVDDLPFNTELSVPDSGGEMVRGVQLTLHMALSFSHSPTPFLYNSLCLIHTHTLNIFSVFPVF